jgi:hypothetical protein
MHFLVKNFKLILLAICLTPALLTASEKGPVLDSMAIDLLVGTPRGVKEPLDERRSGKSEPAITADFIQFLDPALPENAEEIEVRWQDAEEEINFNTDLASSTYLDLMAEIDLYSETINEKYNQNSDINISDSVETEDEL